MVTFKILKGVPFQRKQLATLSHLFVSMRFALFGLLTLAVNTALALPGILDWFPFPPRPGGPRKWVPQGFATTNGDRFEIDGRPFVSYVLTSSYTGY